LAYVVLGVMELPLFQGASFGIAYLFGPTGGYIVGFIAAAYIVGLLTHSGKQSFGSLIASFAIGSAVILACGAGWLMCLYKMNLSFALAAGVLPFIPGDMVKVLIAALIYSRISGRTNWLFST
ncbi:MAG: biotin transporter BioY, partial [Candidatus Omnitrophica bacterium]|nr:biotin transporter BioY [Candidatus Omnitrophota bacterium]